VPLWPVHTWLPDAHTEAPTAGSVILAGVMLKAGAYGFIRFAIPLFPLVAVEAIPLFMALAVVGIIYGALVAMVQPDLKRLVAYSSVSHLGFVMLGIFAFDPQGVEGAIYQMLNHGISTGALFLLVGMLYLRRHTREIAEFGGLWSSAPVYAGIFMVVMLSSIGLPGLNGFVGEFLILLGTYLSLKIAVYFAVTGLILGALYMMWAYERVMWGPLTKAVNVTIADLSRREIAVMVPLLALMFFMGLYPRPLLSRMEPSVDALLARVHGAQAQLERPTATTSAAVLDTRTLLTAALRARSFSYRSDEIDAVSPLRLPLLGPWRESAMAR
jgi:NADH-quinone oxidoreductase subunit M